MPQVQTGAKFLAREAHALTVTPTKDDSPVTPYYPLADLLSDDALKALALFALTLPK